MKYRNVCVNLKLNERRRKTAGRWSLQSRFFFFFGIFFSFLSLFLFFFSHFISAFLGPRIVCECVFVGRRQRWRLRWRRRNTLRHTHFRVYRTKQPKRLFFCPVCVCIFLNLPMLANSHTILRIFKFHNLTKFWHALKQTSDRNARAKKKTW